MRPTISLDLKFKPAPPVKTSHSMDSEGKLDYDHIRYKSMETVEALYLGGYISNSTYKRYVTAWSSAMSFEG